MTFEQLNKELEGFIQESYKLTVDYKKEQEELNEKVKKGLKGPVEVSILMDQRKESNSSVLGDKAKDLYAKIEQVRENELNKIDESVESITADTLAELNLLAQLELNDQEMNAYINKYKNTPLAMKKLQEIASEKRLMAEFPVDRKERLNVVLGRMENSVDRFKNPDYTSYEVKTSMLAEGAIEGHANDVAHYSSL